MYVVSKAETLQRRCAGENVDSFGILACASVSPIITVLLTGIWVNGIGGICDKSVRPSAHLGWKGGDGWC